MQTEGIITKEECDIEHNKLNNVIAYQKTVTSLGGLLPPNLLKDGDVTQKCIHFTYMFNIFVFM